VTVRHGKFSRHMLTDIIEPRAMELLSLIRDDLACRLDGQLPRIRSGGGVRA